MKCECSICKSISEQKNNGRIIFRDVYEQILPELDLLKEDMTDIEKCPKCGFVFPSISENLSKETVELVLGQDYKELNLINSNLTYVNAYKVAMVCEYEGVYKMAARYYMYAGVLSNNETQKSDAYKKAFICISKYHNKYDLWGNVLLVSILRMNGMFKVAEFECDKLIYRKLNSLQRGIVEASKRMVENKDCNYYSYFELLKDSSE